MPGSIEGVDGDVMAMCLAQGHIKGGSPCHCCCSNHLPPSSSCQFVINSAHASWEELSPANLANTRALQFVHFLPQTYIKYTHAHDTYKCCSASSRTISLFLPTCSPVEDLLSCTGRLLDVNMYNSYTAATRQDMSGKRWYSVNLPGITPGGDK